MEPMIDWLNAKPQTTKVASLVALMVAPVALVAAAAVIAPVIVPVLGALAGVALFVAAYGCWHTLLDAEQQDRTNLKAHFGLKQRRVVLGATFGVWLIVMLLLSGPLPGPALGTANVFVLTCLYWNWRATPLEAAEAMAAWEAAQAARTAATDETAGETPGEDANRV